MTFYDLYSPFYGLDAKDNDQWTVKNCFIHMLTEGSIDIDAFRRLIEEGGVSGDIDWGIEKWNIYSEEDHGIKSFFDGYLFFIGEEEHGLSGKGELQVILRENEIKPYLTSIVNWYKNFSDSNVNDFIKLLKNNSLIE
ncbi:hypothetical protein [uncultured Acinetobacter sp.]|uniref:hypothetical protein n=1 Tax=uncultured Acinetobacter sp. TaxID=165433 RepID=UPI002588030D|nr:hypothetical protein [uncultured Acinetobacter sp.]